MEMAGDLYYYQDVESQVDAVEYLRLKRLIWVAVGVGFLSALIYLFSGNKIVAGAPFALTVAILSLINTNFGFMVLLFIPILEEWFVLIHGQSIGGGLSLSKLVAVVIVASYVLTRIGRQIKIPTPLKLMLVIVSLMAVSSLWSPEFMYTFIKSSSYILYVCLAIVFFNTIVGRQCLRLMLWSVFGGNILVAALLAAGKGIHATAGVGGEGLVASHSEEGRLAFAEGGIGANVIAIFLVFGALLGFYFFVRSGLFLKVCLTVAELILFYVLIKTESRSGLIYVVLVPLATYVLAAKKGHMLKTFLGVFIMSIVAMGLFYAVMKTDVLGAEAKERMERTMENKTLTGRTIIWQGGKDLFMRRPFLGWGWASFPLKYWETGRSAHSNYIMIAAELGIVGLLLFGILFLKLLFAFLKIPDYPSRWLGMMCLMWLFITGLGMTSMLTRFWWYVLMIVVRFVAIKQDELNKAQIAQNEWYLSDELAGNQGYYE